MTEKRTQDLKELKLYTLFLQAMLEVKLPTAEL